MIEIDNFGRERIKSRMEKAIFLDIDGTLVSFQTHTMPASAVAALRKAHEQGVGIFISTGRFYNTIDGIEGIRDLVDGYITVNGAFCFVGDEVVCCNPISPADVEAVLAACTRHDFPCIVVGEQEIAVHNSKPIVRDTFEGMLNIRNIAFDAPAEPVVRSQRILQLTPFLTPQEEQALMRHTSDCISARWHPAFTDITAVAADKGKGMEAIARHLNIPLEQCIAFGDGGNDISMVRVAGIGVAMGNAVPELKAAADVVTTSVDDDGIARALQEIMKW